MSIFKTVADDIRNGDIFLKKNVSPIPDLIRGGLFIIDNGQLQGACAAGVATIGHCQCLPINSYAPPVTKTVDGQEGYDYFVSIYQGDDLSKADEWIAIANELRWFRTWALQYWDHDDDFEWEDEDEDYIPNNVYQLVSTLNDNDWNLWDVMKFLEGVDTLYQNYPTFTETTDMLFPKNIPVP